MSTKRPDMRGGESALTVSAWPLRRKVALALAVPLLLAATFGGLRVRSDLVEASNSSASARQVTALRPAVEYLTAAEGAMVAALGSDSESQAALEKALTDIREAAGRLGEVKDSAGLTADQRYQVDTVLDLSQALRAEDAATLSPGTWVAQLRQLQSGTTQLITLIVNEQLEPEPRLELLSQALAGRFSLAMQQALVATERTGETGSLELFSEIGVEGAAVDRLAASLGTGDKAVSSLRTANAQRFRTVRTGGTDLGGAQAYAGYDKIIRTLQDGVDQELESAAAQARGAAAVNAAVTLTALLAAILLALLVSRTLLVPIRRVRQGALAVAHERLPEAVARIRAGEEPGEITPIDVTTGEEIGQLARAVDDMHRQAVVLASREAGLRAQVGQMFVTLSRRNTSLINQQLGLIERLERDEEDPKRLESLFRLDHLAARMRRTADSLLILADAPTTTAVVEGLTVSDALQAATSGVQDYQRVRIRSATSTRLDDSVAADVVHLLTELVDNALTYSPPTSTVSITSGTTSTGVVVEIADAGLGIPAEQLATINESLTSGGEVTPDTARRMGLFVVSRLSKRHGLTTSLRANPEGGTTATVKLPLAVLPDLAPPAAPAPRTARLQVDAEKDDRTPRALPDAKQPRKDERDPAKVDREAEPARTQLAKATPARVGTATAEAAKSESAKSDKEKAGFSKPKPVRAQDERPAPMDLSARIDAALGLPSRTPRAAADPSGAPTPITPSTADAALAALQPLRAGTAQTAPTAPTGLPAMGAPGKVSDGGGRGAGSPGTTPSPGPESLGLPTRRKAATEAGESEADLDTAQAGLVSEAKSAAEPVAKPDAEPVVKPGDKVSEKPGGRAGDKAAATERGEADPTEASVAVPEPEPAAPKGHDSLDGAWEDRGEDGFDTPIFRSLRSAWLSSDEDSQAWRSSEIEAGWEQADRVAAKPSEPEVSESGLPVRRPGSRLVPGGVTQRATAAVRDPEAIRARLAAHASGVSRGRAAAAGAGAAPDPS